MSHHHCHCIEAPTLSSSLIIMPTAPQIDAPLTLCNLFPDDNSSGDEEGEHDTTETWDPCFETQSVILAGQELQIRQFAFHSHNANRVWPGTFNLADYLLSQKPTNDDDSNDEVCVSQRTYQHFWGSILELGTATGLLAIRLALASTQHRRHCSKANTKDDVDDRDHSRDVCSYVVTSDVQDELGDVEANVKYNFTLNVFLGERCQPCHIPHTWGTGWKESVARQLEQNNDSITDSANVHLEDLLHFDTIVASDILLYVSAYDALVATLTELMPVVPNDTTDSRRTRFVMSWNRRMKESAAFFDKMKQAGFHVTHEGKCIYTFVRAMEP